MAGDANDADGFIMEEKGDVNADLGAIVDIVVIDFQGLLVFRRHIADLVVVADSFGIGGSDDDAFGVDVVDIVAADIFDSVDDLLGCVFIDIGHVNPFLYVLHNKC